MSFHKRMKFETVMRSSRLGAQLVLTDYTIIGDIVRIRCGDYLFFAYKVVGIFAGGDRCWGGRNACCRVQ